MKRLEIVRNEFGMSKCPKTVFFVSILDHPSIFQFPPPGGVLRTICLQENSAWLAKTLIAFLVEQQYFFRTMSEANHGESAVRILKKYFPEYGAPHGISR